METKLFKKEKKFKRKKESLWTNIILYWKFAVCFMFVSAVLATVFGFYLLRRINEEPVFPPNVSQVGTVKKEQIDRTLQYFVVHQQKSEQILKIPPPVVDPSL